MAALLHKFIFVLVGLRGIVVDMWPGCGTLRIGEDVVHYVNTTKIRLPNSSKNNPKARGFSNICLF